MHRSVQQGAGPRENEEAREETQAQEGQEEKKEEVR
jgi:hypothetical protein